MFTKSLEEIKKELSKKQLNKFKELIKEFGNSDKIDLIYQLAKKRRWKYR